MRRFALRVLTSSSALLGLAHAVETFLPFVRNVAIARLMEPREFALALTLSTIVFIAEMATDVGIPQLAVKHDISNARARGTLHALAILRAVVILAVVAALAIPLAYLYDTPGGASAFVLAASSLLLRSFTNLGVRQLGRTFKFAPEAMMIIGAQVAWTLAVVGGAFLWRDHRAMIAGLIVYGVAYAGLSQLLSPVRYGIVWDRTIAAEAARFGRPLIPNGVALAVTSLADRLVIGATRGLEALALYGPLVTAAMLPRGTALRYLYSLSLPRMVKGVEERRSLAPEMRGWTALLALLASFFGLGCLALAEPAIRIVFGERYAPAPVLTSLMAVLLAGRVLVAFPVPLAVSTGRTWFVTGSSMIAAVALAPAAATLWAPASTLTGGLALFLGAMAAVEAIGLVVIALRTRRAFPDATEHALAPVFLAWALVAGLCLACHLVGAESWTARLPFAAAGGVAALALFLPKALRFARPGGAS